MVMADREESGGMPSVSVCVSTRSRPILLSRLLDSLEVARAAAGVETEALIADNGSTDDTGAVLNAWAAGGPGRFTLRVEEPGKLRALNRILLLARGSILVFTDDDVEVAPDWLRSLHSFFVSQPQYDAAVGQVLRPAITDPEVLTRLSLYGTIAFFSADASVRDLKSLHGSNMALRRRVFDRVGMFNENLGPGAAGGLDDIELGNRVARAGFRIGYAPDAIVYHTVDPSRLTPEYRLQWELWQARSVVEMDRAHARRIVIPRLFEAFGAYLGRTVVRSGRRHRSWYRVMRYAEILRLLWYRRA
jgi:GT2 family glycosyltransferase